MMFVISQFRRRFVPTLIGAALVLTGTTLARAELVTDVANDFLQSYQGPKNGDMDALSSEVTLNTGNNTMTFTASVNGAVGTTTAGAWVWGLDRGKGTELFLPAFGAGVKFDSVLALSVDPTQPSAFIDIVNGGAISPLPAGAVHVNGNTISATVPVSMLPSAGLAPASYTWNFWPESKLGQAPFVSDFAPDARNAALTVVPEPSSAALAIAGLLMAVVMRLRK
jgi:hypothetical protein